MSAKISFKLLKKQHGFSLFELVVVVLLVGIFMIFAIDRMLRLQIEAERVSVQQVIASLKSAVNLQAAEMVVSKGINAIKTLENTNPMNYLQELPNNYLGAKNDRQAGDYLLASWYYDPLLSILVYKVKNINYFVSSLSGTPRIRLKVEAIYNEEVSNSGNKKVRGISLNRMEDYSWQQY